MQHAALITHFTAKTKSVIRTLDTNNELTFLRIRYRNHEIMTRTTHPRRAAEEQNPA